MCTKERVRLGPWRIRKLLGSCEIGWKRRYERQNGNAITRKFVKIRTTAGQFGKPFASALPNKTGRASAVWICFLLFIITWCLELVSCSSQFKQDILIVYFENSTKNSCDILFKLMTHWKTTAAKVVQDKKRKQKKKGKHLIWVSMYSARK